MELTMSNDRSPRSAAAGRPPILVRKAEIPWEEVDVSFQQFRQSAVRLVEKVTDLLADGAALPPAPESDLKLIRTVFGKWSAEILVALHAAPSFGFEELRRRLSGISPRVLSLKLKELETHGMVAREVMDGHPPRVSYTLTERGWTVAWLAGPALLFLRQSAARGPGSESPARPAGRT
jgi:DNA-binding HxlR family transcriptional regulator